MSQSTQNISSLPSLLPSASHEQDRAALPGVPNSSIPRGSALPGLDQLLSDISGLPPLPDFVTASDILQVPGGSGDILNQENLTFLSRSNDGLLQEESPRNDPEWSASTTSVLGTNPFSTEPAMMLSQNNVFRELRGQCEVDPSNPFL